VATRLMRCFGIGSREVFHCGFITEDICNGCI
jgi:hypothetical protein